MIDIVVDFETRSRLCLKSTNVYKYARHSSTQVLCMSYSIDGGPVEMWVPGDLFPFSKHWPHVRILAFNAEFELLIWNSVLADRHFCWPYLDPSHMDCLQARASYAGYPRKLATIGKVFGLGARGKDDAGHKAMMRLTKPVRAKLIGCEYIGGTFDDDPSRHEQVRRYCKQDTRVECMVDRVAPCLPKREKELWLAHQAINERGVPVDIMFCQRASELVNYEYDILTKRLRAITGRVDVTPDCNVWLKDWLRDRGYPFHSLDEECVTMALGEMPDMPAVKLIDECKEVLRLRQLASNSAVAKYDAIINHADADDRCRGGHIFYKAGPGRFAGAGVNFLNLRRLLDHETEGNVNLADEIAAMDPSEIVDYIDKLSTLEYGGVIPKLASMVRMAVLASDGKKLVVCDYSAIEMRMLHWLARDNRMLKTIRDHDNGIGEEPYRLAAAMIYGVKVGEVTKPMRQVGKVFYLGCGYLAGAPKVCAYAAQQGIILPLDRWQEIVQLYRRSNPEVKRFWYKAGEAAVTAVNEGESEIGPVSMYMVGPTLNIRLPSGRELKYYDAKVVDGKFGPEVAAVDQRSSGVKAVSLPTLIENIDQAASRDLLADALIRCHRENLPVVLHVYDEIVLEVDENDDESGKRLHQIMTDPPKWAKGLPVHAKMDTHRRYTK